VVVIKKEGISVMSIPKPIKIPLEAPKKDLDILPPPPPPGVKAKKTKIRIPAPLKTKEGLVIPAPLKEAGNKELPPAPPNIPFDILHSRSDSVLEKELRFKEKKKDRLVQEERKARELETRARDKELAKEISRLYSGLKEHIRTIERYEKLLSDPERLVKVNNDVFSQIKKELKSEEAYKHSSVRLKSLLNNYSRLLSEKKTKLEDEIKSLNEAYQKYIHKSEGARKAIFDRLDDIERIRKKEEDEKARKQRDTDYARQRQEEEKRRLAEQIRKEERKKILDEIRQKEADRIKQLKEKKIRKKELKKNIKKDILKIAHGIGLYKTEKEKREIELQKQREKEAARRKNLVEARRRDAERRTSEKLRKQETERKREEQRKAVEQRKLEERRKFEEERRKFEEKRRLVEQIRKEERKRLKEELKLREQREKQREKDRIKDRIKKLKEEKIKKIELKKKIKSDFLGVAHNIGLYKTEKEKKAIELQKQKRMQEEDKLRRKMLLEERKKELEKIKAKEEQKKQAEQKNIEEERKMQEKIKKKEEERKAEQEQRAEEKLEIPQPKPAFGGFFKRAKESVMEKERKRLERLRQNELERKETTSPKLEIEKKLEKRAKEFEMPGLEEIPKIERIPELEELPPIEEETPKKTKIKLAKIIPSIRKLLPEKERLPIPEKIGIEEPPRPEEAAEEFEIPGIEERPEEMERETAKKEIAEAVAHIKTEAPEERAGIGDPVYSINKMVDDARDALSKLNTQKARQIYIEIMKVYNSLDDERKGRVYEAIKELYEERKSAEAMLNR